jgi:hypothetical protein
LARVLLTHPAGESKPVLDIALSERNLIVLLSKLYTPGSACSFRNGDVPDGFAYATLRAEPDELHYSFPTREGASPGPMHPIAELVRGVLADVLGGIYSTDDSRPDAGEPR